MMAATAGTRMLMFGRQPDNSLKHKVDILIDTGINKQAEIASKNRFPARGHCSC
jgi:hypothetical protein